jgi:hypothetical protein
MIRVVGVIFFIALVFPARAQVTGTKEESFDYYLELISELSVTDEEEPDYNELADQLYDLWESPININTAEPYDLARLFWLSEMQLNQLVDYVRRYKPLVSIYELAYLPGFDSSLVATLRPFITILNDKEQTNRYRKAKNLFLYRTGRTLERQAGYRDNKFEGDPWKQNFRYRFEYGTHLAAGVNFEKDAGESMFRGSNKAGPDFYSGYVRLNNVWKIKTLCLGHYNLGFGQGLITGPGFSLGKSSQATNLIQKETGIRQYTSTNENRYLQGMAGTVSFNSLDVTGFVSYKKVDANISLQDSAGKVLEVSSLQTTGNHSTATEIADENSLSELTAGGSLAYRNDWIHTGITFIHTEFGSVVAPDPTEYNQFYFKGENNDNVSFDYKLNYANTTIFGEEAIDSRGNPAFVNGIATNLAGRLQLSLVHRYYSGKFLSLYGSAFGENSRVQNEEGFYTGFRIPLWKHWNLAFYADFFRFPWLKYGVDAPSAGKEYMVQAEYNPTSSFSVYGQYRYKLKQANQPAPGEVYNELANVENQRFRIHMNYKVNERFNLSTRLETGIYNNGNTDGTSFLIYQDFHYVFEKVPIQAFFRYAVFDADSYDSRIYAYESDVLYAFSVNAYYKQGQRYFLMFKCSPVKQLDFWIKYSRSVYPHETTVSSGLYEIAGNSRSDLRMQVVWKF